MVALPASCVGNVIGDSGSSSVTKVLCDVKGCKEPASVSYITLVVPIRIEGMLLEDRENNFRFCEEHGSRILSVSFR